MIRTTMAVRTVLAGALGLSVAVPAWAQDTKPPEQPKAPAGTRPATTTTTAKPGATDAKKAADAKSAKTAKETVKDDAVKTAPTWEAYGSGSPESLEETFFRLSRDFASTAEIGVRNLGRVPVWPRGEMKIGNLRILPYLREGVEYDSNFYQSHRTGDYGQGDCANKAEYTHTNTIGALGDLPFAGGRARLSIGADAEWDVRYDDGTDSPDRIGCEKAEDAFQFTGLIAGSYRWPSGVYVRGGYIYEKLEDPVDIDTTGQFPRHNHRPFFTAGMDKDILFGTKARFELGASMRDSKGEEDELNELDRTETEYYLKVSYPFWKDTTRLFYRARYREDERESDQVNDGNVWGSDFGIEGSIPLSEGEQRGLRGSLSIGFDAGKYENEEFNSGQNIRDENDENASLAVNASLQYTMSSKSNVELRYLRSNEFTYHGNYQIVDRVDLTFTHQLGKNLIGRVAGFYEHGDPSGRLSPQPVAGPGVPDGDVSGEYPETNRGGVGFGLRYAINEFADLDFNYNYERRNDRISGFSNHEAGLGVTFYLSAIKPRQRSAAEAGLPR